MSANRLLRQALRDASIARLAYSSSAAAGQATPPQRALLQVDFTTLSKVEDTFPLVVGCDFQPAVVQVARVVNKSDAAARHYEAVWCDWEPIANGIRLRYVTGLAPGVSYTLYLEARGA